ncbi:unnamed protein product [Allacma fusca]|uniref:Beta-1,4-galactosyltransferase n=1 Tax=Allacma fusca TaxID=39272 RepID=A0A8J2PCN2_9HEXA|nr:unnamed protein product [Allacma fusca]
MLRRQQLEYQIFVVEQFGNYTFNKGVLMNAGFLLAFNISSSFDCVVFHDVDLIPEDDRNLYTCASKQPRHLSVAIDSLDYRLPYKSLVGGVFSIRVEDFVQVNGYSNLFWGWGGEDDDISSRLVASHLPISRPNPAIARYRMLGHGRRIVNKYLAPLIRTSRLRFPKDGLTTCKFKLVHSRQELLYTHFLIDLGMPQYVVENKTLKFTEELQLPEKYL